MTRPLLLDVPALQAMLAGGEVSVFDCRFDLADASAGKRLWLQGHVPGAAFADLDRDLAAPIGPKTGRHPLPGPNDFAAFLARCGWREGRPIVAYDAQGGAFAARLWWLMRYFGHDVVSLLDGGWPAWAAAEAEVATGEECFEPQAVTAMQPDHAQVLDAGRLGQALTAGAVRLLDARDADRYAGRNETIDPVAGHVPGASNRPFRTNLDPQGRFHDAETLRAGFIEALEETPAAQSVHMCGSGVTACHNLLAMELAGLPGGRLYAGSWSEWIRDAARPVASGEADSEPD